MDSRKKMDNRKKGLIFMAVGWVTAITLGIGIMFFGWPPVLIFAVPFFGGVLFLAAFESLTDGVLARWRHSWSQRRHS